MKSCIVFAILFSVLAVTAVDAVVVNFGQDRYIICLNAYESCAVLRNSSMADHYADVAARQVLSRAGMSPTLTGKAAQTGTFIGMRVMYANHIRNFAAMHHGNSFCMHFHCNLAVVRFLFNELSKVSDAWATSSSVMSESAVQLVVTYITEIINSLMSARIQ